MTERIEASQVVESACHELGMKLADLVALASIWIHPDVVHEAGGARYPNKRRANLGLRVDGKQIESVGQVIDGVGLDSNNYANVAFKQALGIDRREFVGFYICHIWPGTAYDPDCFTHLANLVGIPAELSSLTDHHPHIVACLKFHAWELYRWKPSKEIAPVKPADYPERWREPFAVNQSALRSANRHSRDLPVPQGDDTEPGTSPRASRSVPVPARRRVRTADETTDASLRAAFYLSKFDHEKLGLGNQGETFDRIATALGVNPEHPETLSRLLRLAHRQ